MHGRLKWPNDVLLADDGDRKLSGILCELVTSGGRQVVVVGTGINVDQARSELPVDTATSLALAGAPEVRREDLLLAYLDHLARGARRRWHAGAARAADDGAAVRTAYRAACRTLGLQVECTCPAVAPSTGDRGGGRRRRRARRAHRRGHGETPSPPVTSSTSDPPPADWHDRPMTAAGQRWRPSQPGG